MRSSCLRSVCIANTILDTSCISPRYLFAFLLDTASSRACRISWRSGVEHAVSYRAAHALVFHHDICIATARLDTCPRDRVESARWQSGDEQSVSYRAAHALCISPQYLHIDRFTRHLLRAIVPSQLPIWRWACGHLVRTLVLVHSVHF